MDFTGCIIAKNEENCISKAIASVGLYCKQIIVVDTGSTDRTPQIATNNNCEVYYKSWNNDFSEVRNYALNFARSDWIIFLDADEILLPFDYKKYVDLFRDNRIGGFSCILRNYLNNDKTNYIEHRYTRIFRNHPLIRYEGAIHEQIADSIIRAGYNVIETDIVIEHYGYIESNEEKKQRNLNLLKSEIEKNPSDYLLFHLANTEFSMNNFVRAKEIYINLLASNELSQDNQEMIRLRLLQIALNLNDWRYILDNQQICFSNHHYEGLKQFIIAACYLHRQQWEKAYTALREAEKSNSSLVDMDLLRKSLVAVEKLIY